MSKNGSTSNYSIEMNEKAEWPYSLKEKDNIEAFSIKTSRGNKICCIYVKCISNPKYTVLFSHGNAVDLGQMSSFYVGLGGRIHCNIFRLMFLKINYLKLLKNISKNA